MHDAQQEFALDEDFPRNEEIGMLSDRARQGVLDGDHGGGDRSSFDAVENFGRAGAGNDCAAPQHALRGFVAEGTEFALNGNLDAGFHHKAR